MNIAVTGSTGRIGRAIVDLALAQGHTVVGLDRLRPAPDAKHPNFSFHQLEMTEYHGVENALRGCDTLVHMAAIAAPGYHPDPWVHNGNVTGSYNALRAAVEVGITRIVQASSVNAIGLSFSREAHFDYLPLDEAHPNYTEEPYSLSKWICEQQADTFARRYSDLRIASMRFHLVVDERAQAGAVYGFATKEASKHLWAYTLYEAGARACLLALDAPFRGHEVFYITAPDTVMDIPSLELAARFFPDVPIRGDLGGNRSFFSTAKAEGLLGWRHDPD